MCCECRGSNPWCMCVCVCVCVVFGDVSFEVRHQGLYQVSQVRAAVHLAEVHHSLRIYKGRGTYVPLKPLSVGVGGRMSP
jgi:hypothetical protein